MKKAMSSLQRASTFGNGLLDDLRSDHFAWTAPGCKTIKDDEILFLSKRCLPFLLAIHVHVSTRFLDIDKTLGVRTSSLLCEYSRFEVMNAPLVFAHGEESVSGTGTIEICVRVECSV